MSSPRSELSSRAATTLDGGSMDCGSGLLLLLTRTLRSIDAGQCLLVRTEEATVPADLRDWAGLAGHVIEAESADGPAGPWHVLVRRDGLRLGTDTPAAGPEARPATSDPAGPREPDAAPAYSSAEPTPVGQRVWLYSNFHCNLACSYCCARSSPAAEPRLLPVDLAEAATAEFVAQGGREVFVTGGEPFLHPQIDDLLDVVGGRVPVTVLTNAMVFEKGRRRAALERLDRDRVTLQISLDSVGPAGHDRHRGAGAHAKAMSGIALAIQLGFRVRIAATLYDEDAAEAAALDELLAGWGVAAADRLIRPVAQQGFAASGEHVTVDTLAPEPTLTEGGVWWHPVAVTDPSMQVADRPLPLAEAFETIRDAARVQDAARAAGRRHVFRCA